MLRDELRAQGGNGLCRSSQTDPYAHHGAATTVRVISIQGGAICVFGRPCGANGFTLGAARRPSEREQFALGAARRAHGSLSIDVKIAIMPIPSTRHPVVVRRRGS